MPQKGFESLKKGFTFATVFKLSSACKEVMFLAGNKDECIYKIILCLKKEKRL